MPDDQLRGRWVGAYRWIHWAVDIGSLVTDLQGRYYALAHQVYIDLARHADGDTGENAYPSIARMAERWWRQPRDIRRALERLEDLGLIYDTGQVRYVHGGEVIVWRVIIDGKIQTALEEQARERMVHRRAVDADRAARYRARHRAVTHQMHGRTSQHLVRDASAETPASQHLVRDVTAFGPLRHAPDADVTTSGALRHAPDDPRPDLGPDRGPDLGPDRGPDPAAAPAGAGRPPRYVRGGDAAWMRAGSPPSRPGPPRPPGGPDVVARCLLGDPTHLIPPGWDHCPDHSDTPRRSS